MTPVERDELIGKTEKADKLFCSLLGEMAQIRLITSTLAGGSCLDQWASGSGDALSRSYQRFTGMRRELLHPGKFSSNYLTEDIGETRT